MGNIIGKLLDDDLTLNICSELHILFSDKRPHYCEHCINSLAPASSYVADNEKFTVLQATSLHR